MWMRDKETTQQEENSLKNEQKSQKYISTHSNGSYKNTKLTAITHMEDLMKPTKALSLPVQSQQTHVSPANLN